MRNLWAISEIPRSARDYSEDYLRRKGTTIS
jgi:hypothetical protein